MSLPADAQNTEAHWGWLAKLYHWGITLILCAQIPLGFYGHMLVEEMRATGDRSNLDTIVTIFTIHKSTGVVIGLIMLARLYWRLTTKRPPLSGELPYIWRLGALSMHWILYVLIFVMVISGYVLSENSPSNIDFYFLFEIPRLFVPGEAIADIARTVHRACAWLLTVLILIHAGAALFHHFAMKDDTLVRILPKFLGGRAAKR